MKNFPITEKIKLQFRTDLFNILNHPNSVTPTPASACRWLRPSQRLPRDALLLQRGMRSTRTSAELAKLSLIFPEVLSATELPAKRNLH